MQPDYLAIVRSSLYVAAVIWALWCVTASQNYARIRLYIWVMLADAIAGGVLVYWQTGTVQWLFIYTVLTMAIASTAALVAWQGLQSMPTGLRNFGLTVTGIATPIAFLFILPWAQGPATLLLLLTGCLMFALGILMLCSSLTIDVLHDSAYRTLGLLWCVQGFMLFLFARGMKSYPEAWQFIGQWLPTLIVVIGLLKLGTDFKHVDSVTRVVWEDRQRIEAMH